MQASGEKPWTGRIFRLMRHVLPTHAAAGGSLFLGYHLIIEFLRHHEHTNLRPMIIDHQIAMGIIGTVSGMFIGGSLNHMFAGFLLSFFTIGPMLYWLKARGMMPGSANVPA